ncbi:MAG: ATP-grasp domain-containing protein [Syntrophales bacterium]
MALAADKQATAEHLAARGVRVPHGVALAPGAPLPRAFEYPAVLKPRFGAGSQEIERLAEWSPGLCNGPQPARLEVWVPGRGASVSFLCGPRSIVPLVPCWQRLSDPFPP